MILPESQSDDRNVICPWCEHAYQAEAEDFSEVEVEQECDKCGKAFALHSEAYVTHYTRPIAKTGGTEMSEHIFEIVDSSDEEAYYTIGIFKSLEEAVSAIEAEAEPWQLCECAMFDGESAAMEIRKRKLGLAPLNTGDVVWSRKWVNKYDEETDDNKWRVLE